MGGGESLIAGYRHVLSQVRRGHHSVPLMLCSSHHSTFYTFVHFTADDEATHCAETLSCCRNSDDCLSYICCDLMVVGFTESWRIAAGISCLGGYSDLCSSVMRMAHEHFREK